MTLVLANKANQSLTLPSLLAVSLLRENGVQPALNVKFEDTETLPGSDKPAAAAWVTDSASTYGDLHVVAQLAESFPQALRGRQPRLEQEWLARASQLSSPNFKSVEGPLLELNNHLTLRTHIVGHTLTIADLTVWGVLRGNRAAYSNITKGLMGNVGRWFRYVEEAFPWTTKAVDELNLAQKQKTAARSKEGASYDIALPDTEKGVVTRFPPEPSGYLHIGHAKAALLNDYFAHEKYPGTLLVRFDDTNPTKEREEFQDAIIEDLSLMGIKPDKTSYTSDYFKELSEFCIGMIKDGNAYADDTEQMIMREERMTGVASKRRDRSVQENLEIFEEMNKSSEIGLQNCIRAKMSVDNPNKAMRDPVIYRCNPEPHHRTGSTWKAYPTYDFCCPIVDSMEGVTHALRTIEYRDRNPQYEWMLDALKLRRVHIWDFARMNFVRTLLSKRKLTKLVEQGVVWGWDDPRFPTIRGIRRRGMTIGALREFILKQGPSRNIVNLDWTIFWATNKRYIDPIAPRHTALYKADAVVATIKGGPAESYTESKPKHGKNAELGTKTVAYGNSILLDQEDARLFAQDEEITLMNWGNAIVRRIVRGPDESKDGNTTNLELELHLAGDVKKTDKKVTWLSNSQKLVPVDLVDFDYLITKDKLEDDDNVEDFLNADTEFKTMALADCNVAALKTDDIIQFERKGYFRVDRPFQDDGKPAVLFNIPTGKTGK